MKVAILGFSENTDRYSNKAYKLLSKFGHESFLVNPNLKIYEGNKVFNSLKDLKDIHTLTVYVNPQISNFLEKDIVSLSPKRVIFNPGSENNALEENLKKQGFIVERACTLVLLNTDQFDK